MAIVELPIVEAAPQDAHDDTSSGAQQTVMEWASLPHVHQETIGTNIGVGVIDTAVDDTHPWFAGQVRGDRADNIDGLLLNNYKAGHATFVAGLVLEQAPAANVIVRSVLDAEGHGATETVIQEALKLVQGRKPDGRREIDILNLSLGCLAGTQWADFSNQGRMSRSGFAVSTSSARSCASRPGLATRMGAGRSGVVRPSPRRRCRG